MQNQTICSCCVNAHSHKTLQKQTPIGATCKDLCVIHRGILQEKLYSENVEGYIYV